MREFKSRALLETKQLGTNDNSLDVKVFGINQDESHLKGDEEMARDERSNSRRRRSARRYVETFIPPVTVLPPPWASPVARAFDPQTAQEIIGETRRVGVESIDHETEARLRTAQAVFEFNAHVTTFPFALFAPFLGFHEISYDSPSYAPQRTPHKRRPKKKKSRSRHFRSKRR